MLLGITDEGYYRDEKKFYIDREQFDSEVNVESLNNYQQQKWDLL